MTNFIQPVWTLKASDGALQNPQYQKIPRTQASQNQKAIGRDEAVTFQYKTIYPESNPHRVNYSNVRPTTITPAQNVLTGNHLRAITKGNDPRADNTKSKPYDMANMRIQETFFTNPSGALIAAAALVGFAIFIGSRGK
tara:strand:+ start:338 stop:754 length:417 start_codon:yes stop_codon:yes gene_type:complete